MGFLIQNHKLGQLNIIMKNNQILSIILARGGSKSIINKNIIDVLSSGQYILGKNVRTIEDKFASHLGVNYAVSCNSGTDALLLSLRAMEIGPGDEVITTPFTYFATAEVIALTGAKPIFADINPHTFNINHKLIEKLITKKTKAVMPVHIFGQSCKLNEIRKICRKYKLSLIEDCAQSHGATYKEKKAGSIGHVGYILIALSSGSLEGFHASVIYIVTYMLMSVGIWSVTSCLEREHPTKRTRTLTDLAMISKSNPVLAFSTSILLFSMAGVPPLAGFYAKFCVFLASINASMYVCSIIIILASVVSTYYYIRLIKTVYFEKITTKVFYKPISKEISLVLGFSFFFTFFFFVNPNLLWLITYEMVLCVVQ